MKKHTLVLALIAALSCFGAAQAETKQEVLENLKRLYPQTSFKSVKESPVDGIFEVVMGRNVAYVDSTGRYFLFGRLIDMPVQKDLTDPVLNEAKRVKFDELPLADAIKTVKGNGKRTLIVFSDPDCPYCRQLEQSLQLVNNVTIYTFLLPLDQIHPEAKQKAQAIWCAKDRALAWRTFWNQGTLPTGTTSCDTPIKRNIDLAQRIHSLATPLLVNVAGDVNGGALPLEKLEQFIAGTPGAEVAAK